MIAKMVIINLDKERHLKLTLKSMFEFERLTNKSLWNITSLQDFTDEEISKILWACCLWEDRELKVDDFLFSLVPKDFALIVNAVIDCLNNAFTPTKGDDSNSPLARKPQIGSKSGLLGGIISIFKKRNSGNLLSKN